jgi:multiple sugar transport system substrate-binding protein
LHFDPRPHGIELAALPPALLRIEPVPAVRLPSSLEAVAFWPLTQLARLLRTRAITSTALTTMYLARSVSLAQHPGHYSLFFDYETGAPLIDSPSFVRALEMSRAAVARMPPAVLSYSPTDCRNAILRGHAALAIALESPGTAHPSDEPGAEAAIARTGGMALGFVRLPGSRDTWNPTRHAWEPIASKGVQQVTLCGFAGLAVAASSRNSTVQTEASWNALARVRGRNLMSGFPAGITGLCRESQLADAADAVGPGLEGTEAEAYAETVATSLRDVRLVAELPVVGRVELREVLARAVAKALDGSQTPEQSLREAAQEWREIMTKIGIEKVRDNYRASLGLSPLARKN